MHTATATAARPNPHLRTRGSGEEGPAMEACSTRCSPRDVGASTLRCSLASSANISFNSCFALIAVPLLRRREGRLGIPQAEPWRDVTLSAQCRLARLRFGLPLRRTCPPVRRERQPLSVTGAIDRFLRALQLWPLCG